MVQSFGSERACIAGLKELVLDFPVTEACLIHSIAQYLRGLVSLTLAPDNLCFNALGDIFQNCMHLEKVCIMGGYSCTHKRTYGHLNAQALLCLLSRKITSVRLSHFSGVSPQEIWAALQDVAIDHSNSARSAGRPSACDSAASRARGTPMHAAVLTPSVYATHSGLSVGNHSVLQHVGPSCKPPIGRLLANLRQLHLDYVHHHLNNASAGSSTCACETGSSQGRLLCSVGQPGCAQLHASDHAPWASSVAGALHPDFRHPGMDNNTCAMLSYHSPKLCQLHGDKQCSSTDLESAPICAQDKHLADILQECPDLEDLSVRGYQGNVSVVLEAVVAHCRALVQIDLADCRSADNYTMEVLCRLPSQLKELAIPRCEHISAEALAAVLKHHQCTLRALDIREACAAEPSLLPVLICSRLRLLKLGGFSGGVARLWVMLKERLPVGSLMQIASDVYVPGSIRTSTSRFGKSWD
jgi:hypothetical protein